MSADPLEAIARATLYEGYVLWPYRRSAAKNRQRWTFGGVFPRGFCEEAGELDRRELRCEVLLGGADARFAPELRFLHLVRRQALDASGAPVDRVEAGGRAHLTWDEAAERRIALDALPARALAERPHVERHVVEGGSELEELSDGAGGLLRTWETLELEVRVSAERVGHDVHRIRTTVANTSGWRGSMRADAQRHALLSTHLVLRAEGGAFHSLADPPAELAGAAAACRNEGVWPALAGDETRRDTVLASCLVLEDFPRVAPESPGDLYDGAEIDQLLVLNVLALTDEEKAEMAATDERAREILERTQGLGPAELARLGGTFRDRPSGSSA